jgi:hypothetical protein
VLQDCLIELKGEFGGYGSDAAFLALSAIELQVQTFPGSLGCMLSNPPKRKKHINTRFQRG